MRYMDTKRQLFSQSTAVIMYFWISCMCSLVLIVSSSVDGKKCQKEETCKNVMSLPLMNAMKATLTAEVDVTDMNMYWKTYIKEEVKNSTNMEYLENMINEVESRMTTKLQKSTSDCQKFTVEHQRLFDESLQKMKKELSETKSDFQLSLDEHKKILNGSLQKMKTELSGLEHNTEDWKWYNGHRYFYSKDKQTWHNAKRACNSKGGYLVKIDDRGEDTWLNNTKDIGVGAWIGANDIDKEGQWTWASDQSTLGYTHWRRSEPNNAYGDEDCAIMLVGGTWNDMRCSSQFRYFCEKN